MSKQATDCAQRIPHPDVLPLVTRVEADATRPLASDLVCPSRLSMEDARRVRRALEEARGAASGLWATLEDWRLQSVGISAAEAAEHRHKMGEAVARAVGRIEATVQFGIENMDSAERRAYPIPCPSCQRVGDVIKSALALVEEGEKYTVDDVGDTRLTVAEVDYNLVCDLREHLSRFNSDRRA
jgi:hypothetical protein